MPLLSRSSLMSVALFAAGALSVIGYSYVTRDNVAGVGPASAQAAHQRSAPTRLFRADENASLSPTPRATEAAAPSNAKPALVVTPENVALWITQATGSDAAKRAAAIEALGHAPKAEALPVLERVLDTADESDRPRALQSFRMLAQREGDTDNRIRNVMRKIISHADDEATTQSAQATLDEIERDLSQAAAGKR